MPHEPAMRLDKWLWHARLCKSRGIAAQTVAAGAVRLNAVRVLKPAAPLRVGDGVTLTVGQVVRVLRVRALGARRGPAAEARELYEDLSCAPPVRSRSLDPDGRLDT